MARTEKLLEFQVPKYNQFRCLLGLPSPQRLALRYRMVSIIQIFPKLHFICGAEAPKWELDDNLGSQLRASKMSVLGVEQRDTLLVSSFIPAG